MSKDPWHSHQHKLGLWELYDRQLAANHPGKVLCFYQRFCTTCNYKETKKQLENL